MAGRKYQKQYSRPTAVGHSGLCLVSCRRPARLGYQGGLLIGYSIGHMHGLQRAEKYCRISLSPDARAHHAHPDARSVLLVPVQLNVHPVRRALVSHVMLSTVQCSFSACMECGVGNYTSLPSAPLCKPCRVGRMFFF